MLLEFGAKNFYSFKEGFEISLRFTDSCPKLISHGKNISNLLAVKGANATGKTNVLKVLSFLKFFCINSFSSSKPEEDLKFYSYFDNSNPTDLFLTFLSDNIEYRYEVTTTMKKVLTETIYRKDKRSQKIIERKDNKIIYTTKEFNELKAMKLRDNASLISTAHQYDLICIRQIYNFFNNISAPNLDLFGRLEQPRVNHNKISELYYHNKSALEFVINFLKFSDTGIHSIEVNERIDKEKNEKEYYPIFNYSKDNKLFLTYFDQSSGVKSLYLQLGYYYYVLGSGGVLVLDEFDVNLHPDLLSLLVNLFDNTDINVNNAQFIFTTHNVDIMEQLSKYRLVFVNKADNESYLYRLDELPGELIRNDRSITNYYQSHKIGGRPKLQKFKK